MGRASPLRAGSAGVRVCPRGWWVLHTRAHRVLVRTAESCGTALSVAITVLLPCAQTPLTTHGNPTTTHHSHQKSPSFQQQPAPHPAEAPPSHVQHQRQPHPKHAPTTPHTEIGPVPARDRSNSARPTRRRSTHDKLEGENHMPHLGNRRQTAHPRKHDRSRHGLRPISSRSKTDLDASFDRSRRGTGPISAKGGRMGERVRARPRPLGVGRSRREETATPPPLALFPCQAREMREASSTCSGVGRTPV